MPLSPAPARGADFLSPYEGRGIWPTGAAAAAGYFAAGIVLTLAGANVNGLFPPLVEPGPPARLLILALGCAGLLFRRRNVPLMIAVTGTAVVAGLLTGGGIISYLLSFEVFYSGILFGSPKLSRAVEKACIYTAVLLAAGMGVAYGAWSYVLLGVLQAVIICIIPLWWAGTLRRQKDVAEQERLRADTERSNAERAAEMAELSLRMALASERAAMARELHDAIAGHLSAVALQSAAALAGDNPELDRRVLAQVRSESVLALNEMRAMIDLLESGTGSLTGDAGSPWAAPDESGERASMAGGLDQLQALAESARLAGNPVELEVSPELETVPEGVLLEEAGAEGAGAQHRLPVLLQSSIYRIVQETLTNAIRHAPGEPVRVQVRRSSDEIRLNVTNSLPAPGSEPGPAADGNGTGLRNMALRATQLSGTFSAGPSPHHDDAAGDSAKMWEVSVRLPVKGTP
ncbi:hypothetical protein KKR91_10290 [Arthrobacter jiangjiafuii]|uniref:histidine kinase n=1 Tax=Arthrobacter jiangjiafuii TaxID=2817475 RepID=A0A975M2T9_9MICC|nr:histidine kinase [Arthrobacter jiangjiafuii]MBP3043393.1 hypothetical protein [Arthrobacter jiangjiafuii]QWC08926.1 hypothetical protein KKR91_10290 [Arthrobacter jiangjiafuii]